MTHTTPSNYRPDIDGLRAVAIVLVVIFHAFPSALPGGFVGVDVFFVISGYLISSIILGELQSNKFSFVGFYARRFRRILPALVVVLLATWTIGWFVLLADELMSLGRHVIAGATFTSNVLLRFEAGYFDAPAESKPLLHLWSLGVEEQFYLVWPIILAFAFRRRWNLGWVCGVLFVVSFALNVALIKRDPATVFYALPTRFWELLLGCGLACYAYLRVRREQTHPDGVLRSQGLRELLAGVAGVSLILSAVIIHRTAAFPGWWALGPTLPTFILIAIGPSTWVNRRFLSNPLAVLLGQISYALYLWHWPFLSIAHVVEEGQAGVAVRVAAVLALALAYATWRLIERPAQLRFFASRPPRPRARLYLAYGSGALVLASCVGAVTIARRGFAERFPRLERTADEMKWNSGGATSCKRAFGTSGLCMTTSADPQLVVWGESHAEMLLPGLASTPSSNESSTILVGEYGCPPLMGIELFDRGVTRDCVKRNTEVRALISSKLRGARTVILVSRGPAYFTGQGFGIEILEGEVFPDLVPIDAAERSLSQRDAFLAGYSRTISFLESQGKHIVFLSTSLSLASSQWSASTSDRYDCRPNGCESDAVFQRTSWSAGSWSTGPSSIS